ncbi:MAG: hypothetical protein ACRECQ_12150, partial [Burkholderiaceae bacterium]
MMPSIAALIEADPRLKYVGRAAVKTALKGKAKNKEVDAYFDSYETAQLLKPARRRRAQRGRIEADALQITAAPRSFQLDVTDFGHAKANRGVRYALLAVDVLSRRAWLYPMKDHKMKTILDNYERFLKAVGMNVKHVTKGVRIQMIEADDEFDASEFKAFNDGLGIQTYTDFAKYDHVSPGGDRLGIIDRLTGTLKRKLEIHYLDNDGSRWSEAIADIVRYYNASPHRTLEAIYGKGTTPDDAWKLSDEEQERRHAAEQLANHMTDAKAPQYEVGEQVRVQEYQGDKLSPSRVKWSKELYTVSGRDGYKYRVETAKGVLLKRRFKFNELQRVPGKPKREAVGLAAAQAATKRDRVEKTLRSRKEGVEPAPVADTTVPLETRGQRSARL